MPSPDRGVRLSYLRHFINEHGGETSFAGKTTAQVCFEFVVPLTKPTELSLVDHVANDPTTASFVAPANWYVSHAWMYLFLETVDSLERFFADRGLADDAVIWFCVFNNNQHLASSYPFEYWSTTFKNGLAAIGNVVMIMHPWNDPIVLRRSWCVFEVYVAVTMGARFEIALARDQEATFLNDIARYDAFGKMLATIKCENSEATVPSDRDGIFGLIRAETSFIAVDRLIFSTLTNWIKTALEASIASTPTPVVKAARWLQLGSIYQNEVDFAEGERCFRRAVTLFAEYRGPFDHDTLQTQALLAYAIAYQRKPRLEWEPSSLSTIRDASEHLGATHNVTLHARSSYALALSWNDDDVAALAVHMDLYDIWRHQYGIRDWHTAGTMNKIGMCHFKLGASRVAARWLQKSLPVLEAHFGVDHSETTLTTSYLAGAFMYSGQQLKALPLQQRLVETSERILGADNPDTILHKMNVAILQILAGHARDAAAQLLPLERSLASRAMQSQQLSDQLRDVRVNLALAYFLDVDYDAAMPYYAHIVDSHPDKKYVSLLFLSALGATASETRTAALARVRSFGTTTDDPVPEMWTRKCDVCAALIVGGRVTCTTCLKPEHVFCRKCLQDHPDAVHSRCAHDASATTYKVTPPPRRYFYEADLMAMRDEPFDAVDAAYEEYRAFCETHDVPMTERLHRTSLPSLCRHWHPMV